MSMFKRDREPSYRSPTVPTTTSSRQPAPAAPEPVEPPPAPAPATAPAEKAPASSASAITPPLSREAAAVVDLKSEITGTLHSQGNVLIEGCFQGEIEAKETVWVEKGAQTKAQLRANDVVISGSFDGEIACQHRLQIAATATISGEIKTPVLVIEEGATVNCRFNMTRSRR